MECRQHSRKTVEQPVRLIQHGRVVAIARAVNISVTGIGIECRESSFEPDQFVGVDFYRPGYPRGVSCHLHARVVHVGPVLIGLVFVDDEATKTLAEQAPGS